MFRTIANVVPTDHRRCLLPSYKNKKRVRIEDFLIYLFTYEIEDLEAGSSELEREGYSVGRFGYGYEEGYARPIDG